MGPSERRGPAKLKNKRRREMSEAIENALSEAMSPKDERGFFERAADAVANKARGYQDKASEYRLTGEVDKYKCGGTVKHGYAVGGDVRYDNKGKCY